MLKKSKINFKMDFFSRLINKFKESKNFKIVGIVIIMLIVVVTIVSVNNDIAPSNSITIHVTDQHGDGINGLELILYKSDDMSNVYELKYTKKMRKTRALEVVPGTYYLKFKNIPKGYTCFTVQDEILMIKDEKLKLEYECVKSK